MKLNNLEILLFRSRFLHATRTFFHEKGFLEIDTPALKKIPGMEPYLDPFLVGSPLGEEKGYLITSPEYSLKQALSLGVEKAYEIAHTFRSGEKGSSYHTAEFLMLEFYQTGIDLHQAMDLLEELIRWIADRLSLPLLEKPFQRKLVKELLANSAGIDWERDSLERKITELSLTNLSLDSMEYEDCFFLVFLNLLEPNFTSEFQFIYDYPPEMAALSRIENGVAKRFELYFGNIELANAFYELLDPVEQRGRFEKEQELRRKLGKEVFPIHEEFLQALERGIPECSGISIGLDRLLMVLLGRNSLSEVSPYWREI
ncbi:EF-P lysine aminoacylase EpmA [Leptospira licerasiae]|uniref:EF-P lysine aminoacylase GenX n=1 Tax=Leptospira licerasiae str. MMD4847 TaxID=1049971 RepID=A0ABN0HEA1_9LEPT|nr:EF-P lysine aminoacylase EpmA [Leptospira licerasiae]EIE01125.1 EF-P lysine aminoacylase GenX [Leptospira licerasiae serovar Varillal str. VAR 010]EJZ43903.1 EF-P lysine aminoacylase GenX [Leptospira licerasiae str. MMD4847]